MKHLDTYQSQLLSRLLLEAELEVPVSGQTQLLEYLDAIIEANQKLNLTRISEPSEAVRLHLVDSLLALPEVQGSPTGPLLDIGTGGGFPGVPLAHISGRSAVLLDSVGKKARAVNQVLELTHMIGQIVAIPVRAEEHVRGNAQVYGVITARAVAELPSLVELSAPLLATGGRLVALKGSPEQSELDRGRKVAGLVGLREVGVRRVVVPGGGEKRCLVSYERVGSSSVRLPRRPGEAQRSPLA